MTAETARTTGEAGAGPDSGEADAGAEGDGGSHGRWAPGTGILWRYRANGAAHPHICRPVTVVRDTPDLLAAWVAPGTVCVKPEMADGTPVHHEPLETRYTKPRRTVLSRWFGTGVLKLARPGEPWSVWLFWEQEGEFKNWYVNLEEPLRRWPGGVDSEDHFLDISVYPDRTWEWRDEDEFAAAQHAGLVDEELASRVRTAGNAVVEQIHAWASPFRDGWENWRPDPGWRVPRLPHDWDGRPGPVPPPEDGFTSAASGGGTASAARAGSEAGSERAGSEAGPERASAARAGSGRPHGGERP